MYKKVEKSQTLLINAISKKLLHDGKDLIQFGFGQSPFDPPTKVIDSLINNASRTEYTSIKGNELLRELISKFHFDHNGLKVHPKNIFLAPGSKVLIFNILIAHDKSDFLIPAPSWVSYQPQGKLCGHNCIYVPTSYDERWRINPDNIHHALSQKKCSNTILILNYPGNPDGLSYSTRELIEIAEIMRKHEILVISDEIYALLDHSGKHKSLASFYPEKTITTTGLSKWCGAGGWRFGAALISDRISSDFKESFEGIGSETYSCAPAPVQYAAIEAYSDYSEIIPYLKFQTTVLKNIGNHCADMLRKAGIKVHSPEGGFYLFLDFSSLNQQLFLNNIKTSIDLCESLLENKGVALLPATAFGFKPDFLGARLAYVDFEINDLQNNLDIQVPFPRIKRGLALITEWLNEISNR